MDASRENGPSQSISNHNSSVPPLDNAISQQMMHATNIAPVLPTDTPQFVEEKDREITSNPIKNSISSASSPPIDAQHQEGRERNSSPVVTTKTDNHHPPDRRKTPPHSVATTTEVITCAASDDGETIDMIAAEIAKTNCDSADVPMMTADQKRASPPLVRNCAEEVHKTVDIASIRLPALSVSLVQCSIPPHYENPSNVPANGPTLFNGDDPLATSSPTKKVPTTDEAPLEARKDATSYEEVENKLAEMFAGIDDEVGDDLDDEDDDADSTDDDYHPVVDKRKRKSTEPSTPSGKGTMPKSRPTTKTGTTKGARKAMSVSTATFKLDVSDGPAKRGRKKKTAGRPAKLSTAGKLNKKGANKKADNSGGGKRKSVPAETSNVFDSTLTTPFQAAATAPRVGPFVHVRNDGSSNVINGPGAGGSGGLSGNGGGGADDIAEAAKAAKIKAKGGFSLAGAAGLSSVTAGDRSKIRGLHLSTLSNKYDAETTDTTWMCVFCKQGPHRYGLGDLFGPYLVQAVGEEFEQCLAYDECGGSDDIWRRKSGVGVQQRSIPTTATSAASGSASLVVSSDAMRVIFTIIDLHIDLHVAGEKETKDDRKQPSFGRYIHTTAAQPSGQPVSCQPPAPTANCDTDSDTGGFAVDQQCGTAVRRHDALWFRHL